MDSQSNAIGNGIDMEHIKINWSSLIESNMGK